MVEFAYNNPKNASIGHMSFKLNCSYHLRVFFEKDIDPHFRSYFADELAQVLKDLIIILLPELIICSGTLKAFT